ncbi:MAG: two-component sensor histidine kinase [Cytophagaceae bacterium]|nr:two-component sensor histidine kinase [Cytophagaceae bacterium]
MKFRPDQRFSRWFIIISALIITGLILWNVSIFFDHLKKSERERMEIWASSLKALNEIPLHGDFSANTDLIGLISQKNTSIPIIVTDGKGTILNSLNIPDEILQDSTKVRNLMQEMATENEPVPIQVYDDEVQMAYYKDSTIITQLVYFPFALIIVMILFAAVIYFVYTSSKASEQNLLWAGMAKETAHQIGTPLSSLVGWTEILKTENIDPEYIEEINKDIDRLKTITGRFSKIGSVPVLEPYDIIEETQAAFDYLAKRSSKLVQFKIDVPQGDLMVMLNRELYGWTIENLVKNGIDAMKGKGTIKLVIKREPRNVLIQVSDTGKGIPKKNYKKVFQPGYTTKKRGWGLGLSLAKRIIDKYHNGNIKVLKSDPGKGTTFQVALKLIKNDI